MAGKITDWCFEYGGLKYFRGNAHLLQMGTFGDKHDPPGAKAYVDPEGTVKSEYLASRVKEGQPVDINWSQTTKAEVEVNGLLKVFGLNRSGTANYTYEKAKGAHLKLYNLSIAERQLRTMLNNDADVARRYLADEGKNGRIVSEVWVVMEAELAEHFESSGGISVAASGSNLNVTAKGGKHGTQTITLASGTTFAYKLHKVTDWSDHKTHIEDMEADYKGMG